MSENMGKQKIDYLDLRQILKQVLKIMHLKVSFDSTYHNLTINQKDS